MSANGIPQTFRPGIQRMLDDLDRYVETEVLMTDSPGELYVIGAALLQKTRQVLSPIMDINKMEELFIYYARTIREKGIDKNE
jgi:hypothetical protein